MNLGILNCDQVSEALARRYGQYPDMFAAFFKTVDPQMQFTVFDALKEELPQNIDAADAYLITGSRYGVNDGYPWIAQLEDFVRVLYAANKKIIGICFGHQLIAKALGGEVIKSPKGWGVGVLEYQVVRTKEWMQPARAEFTLLASHQDQVVMLPPDAEVLAASEFCPNYMLQIGNNILTIQGHPEFTKDYAKDLLHSREDMVGDEVYAEGMHSMVLKHEHFLMAQWIVHFLQSK